MVNLAKTEFGENGIRQKRNLANFFRRIPFRSKISSKIGQIPDWSKTELVKNHIGQKTRLVTTRFSVKTCASF